MKIPSNLLKRMAQPLRFELKTSAFGGQRSIQLSYGCACLAKALPMTRGEIYSAGPRLWEGGSCAPLLRQRSWLRTPPAAPCAGGVAGHRTAPAAGGGSLIGTRRARKRFVPCLSMSRRNASPRRTPDNQPCGRNLRLLVSDANGGVAHGRHEAPPGGRGSVGRIGSLARRQRSRTRR